MTDADGTNWPPESNITHPDHLSWVRKFPPETPFIHGRDGTVFKFGALDDKALRAFHGGEVTVSIPPGTYNVHPVFPTPEEYRAVKENLSMENEEVLRRRIERARRDIDDWEDRLSWLESLPDEPDVSEDGDGPVIYFRKSYGDVERHKANMGWQYAAVRVQAADHGDSAWYVTGGNRVGLNCVAWRELLAFIFMKETSETSPTIWMATGWDVLS